MWICGPTRSATPAALISEAVGRALHQHLGLVAKTARSAGLDSISLGGLKIDTSKIGKIDGATLADALRALFEMAKAPVALIIDEAQHALTSEAGENAMAALSRPATNSTAPAW